MPDNNTDGLMEDFIKSSVIAQESTLLDHAIHTVAGLSIRKFNSLHTSKAEIATWMAWQTMPGKSLAGAVSENLLDFNQGYAQAFIKWLRRIFSGAT